MFISFILQTHLGAQHVHLQDVYTIKTIQGEVSTGRLLSRDSVRIVLLNEAADTVSIPYFSVIKMESHQALRESPPSHFLSGTAHNLNRGDLYFEDLLVVVPQIKYGVTDFLSVTAGLYPGNFFGAEGSPMWLSTQLSHELIEDRLAISLTSAVGETFTSDGLFGGAAVSTTLGSRDRSLTIHAGRAYFNHKWKRAPFYGVSALIKTSSRSYFISENYYLRGQALLSFGGRRMLSRVSLDYGFLLTAWEVEQVIPIPWLGVKAPLGVN